MKFAIVFVCCVAVALAATPQDKPSARIVSQTNDFNDNGGTWGFESDDGIKRSEQIEVKTIGDGAGAVMKGEYEYIGDDGNTYKVTYIADENGFQPSAPHLVGRK